MTTLAEYRARGGFVAFVPGEVTHISTQVKTIRETTADGRAITRIGPEMLTVDVIEGRRMVRFNSIEDYRHLRSNNRDGLNWQRLNPELEELMAQLSRSNRQPGAIWA